MADIPQRKKDILVYGAWPDPRSSGISSVVHDTIKGMNEEGYNVYLITRNYNDPNPTSIDLMEIPGDRPFDWQETVKAPKKYSSFPDLIKKDSETKKRDGDSLLSRIGIIHSHFDDLIPNPNENERSPNNYQVLADYITRASGERPKLVRTRHDETHEGIDRLNRLTGLDWERLSPDVRESYLKDGTPLKDIVRDYVSQHRNEMKQKYRLDDLYLDNAIDHVWYALHQLRLWQREADDFDTIINHTRQDADETKRLGIAGEQNYHKFFPIHNGSSFSPKDMDKINGLLEEYHHNGGLECYRAGDDAKEKIYFSPEDKKMIFVGRANSSKGSYELAQSLANLRKKGIKNIKGIFVGGGFDARARRELEALDPENARDYLLFTGRVEDPDVLASIYSFGNATVIPSHYECFNLVGVESLKLGKPLIVTNFSGPGEIYIKHPEKYGIRIALPVDKPHKEGPDRYYGVDLDSLESRIREITTDDALAAELGERGKQFVEEHYSHHLMGKRYAELFSSLMGNIRQISAKPQKSHAKL